MFRDNDNLRAIAACDNFSDRYSRRISAQSSTVITLQSEGCSLFDRNYLLTFRPEPTSGKDGGREATYDGTIDWSRTGDSPAPDRVWTGYTVVQAKQHERPSSLPDDLSWLKTQIRRELDSWADRERRRLPNNLLFVTNVRLSAVEKDGGVDKITKFLKEEIDRSRHDESGKRADTLRERGLREAFVWHRDTLNALISGDQSIRDAFPALLTTGDILTRLAALPGKIEPAQLARSSLSMRRVRYATSNGCASMKPATSQKPAIRLTRSSSTCRHATTKSESLRSSIGFSAAPTRSPEDRCGTPSTPVTW